MKKSIKQRLVSGLLCTAVLLCIAVMLPGGTLTARAAEQDQQLTTEQKEGATQLSARKDASYIVVIPRQAQIAFDNTSTSIGSLVYEEGNLEPDSYVTVTLSNQTSLAHTIKDSYTIPFMICGEDKTTAFTSVIYDESTKTGTKTPLTAEITQADWEAAKAGSYQATLTFQISYMNPHEGE